MLKFYNQKGNLTRYAFACGYIERNKHVTLSMEHGVYIVRGFVDGTHINESFRNVTDARKVVRKYA